MFIVIKVLLISSATVIIRGGGHLVERLCYGGCFMCSVVTIVLECLVWVLLCKEVGSSLVFFCNY